LISRAEPAGSAGLKRHWRWYCTPGSGRKVVREDLDQLAEQGRAALMEAIGRFRRGEGLPDEVKKLTACEGLWEIRVRVVRDHFRAIFFYDGRVCVCVTVVQKNQQLLPAVAKRRAMNRMSAWVDEGRQRKTQGRPTSRKR